MGNNLAYQTAISSKDREAREGLRAACDCLAEAAVVVEVGLDAAEAAGASYFAEVAVRAGDQNLYTFPYVDFGVVTPVEYSNFHNFKLCWCKGYRGWGTDRNFHFIRN